MNTDLQTIIVVSTQQEAAAMNSRKSKAPSTRYVAQMTPLYGIRVKGVIDMVPNALKDPRFGDWWETGVLCRIAP